MTTLTDRYVWAVVRDLPEAERPEVAREVRAMVADLVEARLDGPSPGSPTGVPPSPDEVERAVLADLGEPSRLAVRYAPQPRSLIEPHVFPEYLRVLKVVAAIAIPTLVVLTIVGVLISGEGGGYGLVGRLVGTAYQAGVQVAFWVTVIYAFAHRWKEPEAWTPDDLPELPAEGLGALAGASTATGRPGPGLVELALGVGFTVVTAVALVAQHLRPFVREDGVGIPILDPRLWNGVGQALVAVLAVSTLVQMVVLVRRRWSLRLAVANGLLNVTSFALVAWAALADRLVNPDLLALVGDRLELDRTPTISPWAVVATMAAIEGWDAWQAFHHARAASAAPTPSVPAGS